MSILSVTAYGIVQAKRPGIATMTVVSTFDSQNFDEVIVEVSIPSSMVMLQNFPVETVVGSHLHAAVTMKTLNGASFSKCDAFSSLIKWKTASESFVIVNVTSEMLMLNELRSVDSSPPCSQASIYTSSPGRTVLQATLAKEFHYFDKSLSESIDLKATLSIGAYLPLSVRQYSDGNHHGLVNKLDVIRAASQADRAPGRLRVTPVTVANEQIIRVAAVGISKFGEAFFSQVGTEQLQQFGILEDDDNSLRKHGLKSRFSFANQKEMRRQSAESADKEGNPFSIECAVGFVVEMLTQNLQTLDQFMQDSSENESCCSKEVSPNDSPLIFNI